MLTRNMVILTKQAKSENREGNADFRTATNRDHEHVGAFTVYFDQDLQVKHRNAAVNYLC